MYTESAKVETISKEERIVRVTLNISEDKLNVLTRLLCRESFEGSHTTGLLKLIMDAQTMQTVQDLRDEDDLGFEYLDDEFDDEEIYDDGEDYDPRTLDEIFEMSPLVEEGLKNLIKKSQIKPTEELVERDPYLEGILNRGKK